jgi:hypothetical protein
MDEMGWLVFGAMALMAGIALEAFFCLLLYKCFQRIPKEFRKQEPGLVWLLFIPLFSLVWTFFVYPKLSDSYRAYFASVGRKDLGDCGKGVGLAYCIFGACCIIPGVGWLVCLAAVVLQIIFVIKAWGLRGQIPALKDLANPGNVASS